MKTNVVIILFLSILLSSCTKEEKKFISLVEAIKEYKTKVISVESFPIINIDLLSQLKEYSEKIDEGTELFEELLSKSKSRKRLKKYLTQDSGLPQICSTLFLEMDAYSDIENQCTEGFFNICPISFSRYQDNSDKIIKNLKELLGEQKFSETDCINYINEEL